MSPASLMRTGRRIGLIRRFTLAAVAVPRLRWPACSAWSWGSAPVEPRGSSSQVEPLLSRGGAVPRPLLGLPHARASSAPRARRPASRTVCRPTGPTSTCARRTSNRCCTRSATAASPGAIMPENIVLGDDAKEVAEFLAKYSGPAGEEGALGGNPAVHQVASGSNGRREHARPQADPRGSRGGARRACARGPSRGRGTWTRDRAGCRRRASCSRSSSSCAPSRTKPTRASRRRPTPTPRAQEIEAMRAVAARAKESEAELGVVEEELQARSRRCPTCPIPRAAAGPEDELVREVGTVAVLGLRAPRPPGAGRRADRHGARRAGCRARASPTSTASS